MKRLITLGVIVLAALLFWSTTKKEEKPTQQTPPPLAEQKQSEPLLFDHLLANHGQDTPQRDLEAIQNLATQFGLYHKSVNTAFYNSNLALTEQLLQHRELSVNHPTLGKENGEPVLLDRWQSPYILHFEGSQKIQVRSPGPDKTPYTKDDLIWPR